VAATFAREVVKLGWNCNPSGMIMILCLRETYGTHCSKYRTLFKNALFLVLTIQKLVAKLKQSTAV